MTPEATLACALEELRFLRRVYRDVPALAACWYELDLVLAAHDGQSPEAADAADGYDPFEVAPKPDYRRWLWRARDDTPGDAAHG